jgi:hypothetical protein
MDPTSGKVAPASLGVLLLPKHAAVASGIAVTERQERRKREEDRSLTSRLLGKGTAKRGTIRGRGGLFQLIETRSYFGGLPEGSGRSVLGAS